MPGPHPGEDAGEHDGQLERAERDVPRQRVQVEARPGGVGAAPPRPGAGSRAAAVGLGQVLRGAPDRVLVGLVPVDEQQAEVGQRVAERGELPVQHRADPARVGGVEQAVVDAVVAVHDRVPLGGRHRVRAARRRAGSARPASPASAPRHAGAGLLPLGDPAPHLAREEALGPAEVAEPDRLRVDGVQRDQHVDQRLARPAPLGLGVGPSGRQLAAAARRPRRAP